MLLGLAQGTFLPNCMKTVEAVTVTEFNRMTNAQSSNITKKLTLLNQPQSTVIDRMNR